MRSRHIVSIAVLVAAVAFGIAQWAAAHGGGGGGHGGGGGGHGGGGFGGGHGGGFGGGGMHGGGGFHSGFSGGMHSGGMYSGGMHSGGMSPGMHSPSMGHIGGSGLGSPGISGGHGISGAGHLGNSGMHNSGNLGANSHINQSLMSHGAGSHTGLGATHNAAAHTGNANNAGSGHLTSLTHGGNQLSGLGHNGAAANGAHHQSQFLTNHGAHTAGFRGNNNQHLTGNAGHLHNGNFHNGNFHNGNFNHFNHFNNFNRFNRGFFSPFFFGGFWPWWGYGFGYGYPYYGYGWGYPWWYLNCGYPFYGYSSLGFGLWGAYGYGYGGGYGYGPSSPYYAYNYGTDELAGAANVAPEQTAAADIGEFAAVGETDFRAGNYDSAVRAWRHALLDDPTNGTLMMMLGQALFATGKFDEAAGAVEQGMTLLPEDQWGVVVSNYRELYAKIGDYTTQLRALEKSVKEKPNSPALRLLVGYHYGYLGYPKDAVAQLEKVRTLAPQDELAKRLYAIFEDKAAKGETPADKPAEKKKAPAELPPQAKAALPTF